MRTEPHGTWRRVRRANGANTAESIRAHTTHARRAWHVACGMPRIGSFSRLLFDEWVVHARCVAPHLRQRVPLPPGRARGVVKAQHDRCQCCRHVGTASAACSANVPHLRSTLWISLAGRGVLLRSLSNQTPRSTCAGPAPYVVGGEREGPGGRRATAQRTEGAAQQVPATAPLATGTALAHQGNFTILSREFKQSDTTAPTRRHRANASSVGNGTCIPDGCPPRGAVRLPCTRMLSLLYLLRRQKGRTVTSPARFLFSCGQTNGSRARE